MGYWSEGFVIVNAEHLSASINANSGFVSGNGSVFVVLDSVYPCVSDDLGAARYRTFGDKNISSCVVDRFQFFLHGGNPVDFVWARHGLFVVLWNCVICC